MPNSVANRPGYPVLHPRGHGSVALGLSSRFPATIVTIPGAAAYGAVAAWVRRARLRRRGTLPPGVVVVSVGNIELGGNGKTPLAIHLVEHLTGRGRRPVYISRGFGSTAEKIGAVTVVWPETLARPPALEQGVRWVRHRSVGLSAAVGDEGAVVAARCPTTPIFFCRDRSRAIEVAMRSALPSHIILDDAFQTWAVPRHIDIVMLDAHRPFGNGRLVPAGTLREPPRAIARAGFVGLNGVDNRWSLERLGNAVTACCGPAVTLFGVKRRLRLVTTAGSPVATTGEAFAVLSSIARPVQFEGGLEAIGVKIALALRYPDHHRYSYDDVRNIVRTAEEHEVAGLITTEKDWVKLRDLSVPMTCAVAHLDLEIIDGSLLDAIETPQGLPAA